MGKRKQPFGYKMEFGDIVPEPEEAETVRSIYLKYLAGASFKVLAESLQEQGLPYDGDKPWNKNMVARILENQRYTGTDSFPPLITEEQFLAAQERRKRMTPERTQTPAQKELRNHENYDAIESYPVEEWHGGKIQRIRSHGALDLPYNVPLDF